MLRMTGSASALSLAAAAIATTLFLGAISAWGLLSYTLVQSLVLALPLSLLMAIRLAVAAAGQAQQRFIELSKTATAASAASLGTFTISIGFGQASEWSWIAARVLLEVIVIAGMWNVSFGPGKLTFRPWQATAARARFLSLSALPLGISLFLRSLLDQGPILLASVLTASAGNVAEVGLIVTICTIALVPALTAQGVFVPRLVETVAGRRSTPYGLISLYLVVGAATTALIASILLTIVPVIVSWANSPPPAILALVAIIVGAKMAAGAIGGVLLALERNRSILAINVSTALAGLAAAVALFARSENSSTEDFLIAIAVIEVIGVVLYLLFLFNHWRTDQLSEVHDDK